MKKLFEDVQLMTEGSFQNLLRGGKVPIGQWTFVYRSNDVGFIARSAQVRGLQAVGIPGEEDAILVTGNSLDHLGLIASLQSLGVDGNVSESSSKLSERAIPQHTGVEVTLPKGTEVVDHGTGEILILNQKVTAWKVERPEYNPDFPRGFVTFWNKGGWMVGYDQNIPLFLTSHSKQPVTDEYPHDYIFGVL